MQDLLGQVLTALVERLTQEFPELLAVYRFGSFGSEYKRPDSDLDLGVRWKAPIGSEALAPGPRAGG